MSTSRTRPLLEIWIPRRPQSFQKKGSKEKYVDRIRATATDLLDYPLQFLRIDVEIWFSTPGVSRSDVDKIIESVLDAFVGIVYVDDSQVWSVKAVAITSDDAISVPNKVNAENILRVLKGDESLVMVHKGRLL